jgi:hypothetical protein
MKIWLGITDLPADVYLEWSLAFMLEDLDIPLTDFRLEQIFQSQRINICKALKQTDLGRKYLELFYDIS